MKTRDILSYSFSAIRLRKLRAGLTTLGVVIGIAAIVALLSISQGLQATITSQLERGFATDTLIVTAGSGSFGMGGGLGGGGDSGFKLLVSDTQIINDLPNVDTSVAIVEKLVNVTVGATNKISTVVGVNFTEYYDIYSDTFEADRGTIPLNPENDSVVVVGRRVIDPRLNGTVIADVNDPIDIIWINATARPPTTITLHRNITAILKQIGSSFGVGGPSDSNVYIPITQAQMLFNTNESDMIIAKLKSSDQTVIDNATKAIKAAFSGEVSVISATAILGILSSVFSIIELFLGGIAAISLIVAGVGIMNIMIVSLMERTREIGILKALGTKGRTVLLIFLCEAVIIGLMGGTIGVGLGWVLANIVAVVFRGGGVFMGNQANAGTGGMTITPILTLPVFFGALAFGVGVSVIFALYPAWRASKLKPVDALRYE
ncbi:MAG TPA: ABC transporter permease [Patescibacteria group bacterium]|nr:ABC transporter permease [Patescibacteria group bacterium]